MAQEGFNVHTNMLIYILYSLYIFVLCSFKYGYQINVHVLRFRKTKPGSSSRMQSCQVAMCC